MLTLFLNLASSLALLLIPFAVLVALHGWTRWLRRRTAAPSYASQVAYGMVLLAAAVMLVTPVACAIYGFFRVWLRPQVDAPQKSRILAEVIAAAMNVTVLAWIVGVVVSAVWLLFSTWRWHWAVRPSATKGDPPYR